MVREDQFLRPSAVDDVCHPIVEVRRSAPRDGDAAQPQAPPSSTFASGFRLPSIVALTSGYAAPVGGTEEPLDERRSSLANLTSVAISVSRLRLSAKNARARPARGSGPRGIGESLGRRSPWTNGS